MDFSLHPCWRVLLFKPYSGSPLPETGFAPTCGYMTVHTHVWVHHRTSFGFIANTSPVQHAQMFSSMLILCYSRTGLSAVWSNISYRLQRLPRCQRARQPLLRVSRLPKLHLRVSHLRTPRVANTSRFQPTGRDLRPRPPKAVEGSSKE